MKKKRQPLTREMLLPMPAAQARALALEYHLALSVLAADQGTRSQFASLLRAVCHAQCMTDAGDPDRAVLEDAAQALDVVLARACRNQEASWAMSPGEQAAVAQALAIHDRLTARVPYHRFVAAWHAMQRHLPQVVERGTIGEPPGMNTPPRHKG